MWATVLLSCHISFPQTKKPPPLLLHLSMILLCHVAHFYLETDLIEQVLQL